MMNVYSNDNNIAFSHGTVEKKASRYIFQVLDKKTKHGTSSLKK
jgi:hypothetical protein